MHYSDASWMRASKMAMELYDLALQSGATHEVAVAVAIARARSVIRSVSEYDVREAMSIRLAEVRLAAGSKPQR
jgi:hypothetical protein